jgi:hypothetical protein
LGSCGIVCIAMNVRLDALDEFSDTAHPKAIVTEYLNKLSEIREKAMHIVINHKAAIENGWGPLSSRL